MHGILSGRAIERLVQSSIRSIGVTASVPIAPAKRIDKLTVLSVAPLFAAGIKAIHDAASASMNCQTPPDVRSHDATGPGPE